MKYSILKILSIIFISTVCYGQSSNNSVLKTSTQAAFIENKGQIIDQHSKPNPSCLFLLNMPGMNVQLRRQGFSYDIFQIHPNKDKIYNCCGCFISGDDSRRVSFISKQ